MMIKRSMIKRFTLVDDIERSNTCYLVNGTISYTGQRYTATRIYDFHDLIKYINNKYGEGMFGFITTLYGAYGALRDNMINNDYDDCEFNIATLDREDREHRYFRSSNYNYAFNTINGSFARWGKTMKDDPLIAPMGPEIADIEISTICNGLDKVGPCKWCYKSNNGVGHNMTLDDFKRYLAILNQHGTLMQIAFGIGDIDGNKDLFAIMEHTRENGIIPNITINGARMTDEYYEKLAKVCGAVSVSRYDDDVCFNAVEKLTSYINRNDKSVYAIDAVNIHQLLSDDTIDDCMRLLKAYKDDPRIGKVRAIVFLTIKPIGTRNDMSSLTNINGYKKLVEYAMENVIPIGFDSCGCYNFLNVMKSSKEYGAYLNVAESCESSLFSIYVNSRGIVSPCSFTEKIDNTILKDVTEMNDEIDLNKVSDLLMDVWYSSKFNAFRRALLGTIDSNGNEIQCRYCPTYNLNLEKDGE